MKKIVESISLVVVHLRSEALRRWNTETYGFAGIHMISTSRDQQLNLRDYNSGDLLSTNSSMNTIERSIDSRSSSENEKGSVN